MREGWLGAGPASVLGLQLLRRRGKRRELGRGNMRKEGEEEKMRQGRKGRPVGPGGREEAGQQRKRKVGPRARSREGGIFHFPNLFHFVSKFKSKCKPIQIRIWFEIHFLIQIKLRSFGKSSKNKFNTFLNSFIFKFKSKCKPNQIRIGFEIHFLIQIKLKKFGKFSKNKFHTF